MTVAELIKLLQELPQHESITLPFPLPDKNNLTEHEPFMMHTKDGILLVPKAMVEMYIRKFPEDIIG